MSAAVNTILNETMNNVTNAVNDLNVAANNVATNAVSFKNKLDRFFGKYKVAVFAVIGGLLAALAWFWSAKMKAAKSTPAPTPCPTCAPPAPCPTCAPCKVSVPAVPPVRPKAGRPKGVKPKGAKTNERV